MEIRSFKDLLAWQKSLDLVEMIYASTRSWPRDEIYGLTSQVRRAAVSVPSNIAEGHGRATRGQFDRLAHEEVFQQRMSPIGEGNAR